MDNTVVVSDSNLIRCARCGSLLHNVELWMQRLVVWICRECAGCEDAVHENDEKLVCKTCGGDPKPISEFGLSSANRRFAECKTCRAAAERERYHEKAEEQAA
jgi:hypothetical protein